MKRKEFYNGITSLKQWRDEPYKTVECVKWIQSSIAIECIAMQLRFSHQYGYKRGTI